MRIDFDVLVRKRAQILLLHSLISEQILRAVFSLFLSLADRLWLHQVVQLHDCRVLDGLFIRERLNLCWVSWSVRLNNLMWFNVKNLVPHVFMSSGNSLLLMPSAALELIVLCLCVIAVVFLNLVCTVCSNRRGFDVIWCDWVLSNSKSSACWVGMGCVHHRASHTASTLQSIEVHEAAHTLTSCAL